MKQAEFSELFSSIVNNPKFLNLALIGGEKVYHHEGDALMHTMMVTGAARQIFGMFDEMVIIALLHDIGKIYTSIQREDGWWNYPNHSISGAEHLKEFLSEDHPLYKKAEWYIKNHIKPMFFNQGSNFRTFMTNDMKDAPEGVSLENLCKLVLCDWTGSVSPTEQDPQLEMFIKRLAKV